MNWHALLCVPLGHKWGEAPGVVEIYPVLRCKRCAALRNMGGETRDPTPSMGHRASPTGMMSGRVGHDGRPE